MDLDRKIILIQKSTKTLFDFFVPIHEWLRQHSRLYYVWSFKPYARVVHWTILFLYICALPAIFSSYFPNNAKTSKASGETYDFPRWEWVNPAKTGNDFNDVYTPDSNHVWIVGDHGTILKKNAQFQQIYSGTSENLNAIDGADSTHIWAVGNNGTILKYDGTSWKSQTSNASSNLLSISAVDANTAWACGGNSVNSLGAVILFTSDGGETWITKQNNDYGMYVSISAPTANTAFSIYKEEQMVDEENGPGFAWTFSYIAKTTNNGSTWSTPSGLPYGPDIHQVDAYDESHLWARGSAEGYDNQLFYSSNGGASWNARSLYYHCYDQLEGEDVCDYPSYTDITTVDANTAWVVGIDHILKTTDAGLNWTVINSTEGEDIRYYGVDAVSSNDMWAVGSSAKIFSIQNGISKDYTSGTNLSVSDIETIDDNTAWIATTGSILKTTDGGANYIQQPVCSIGPGANDIEALDTNTAWTAKSTGICRTTDGGTTWLAQATDNVSALTLVGPTTAWAVGPSGKIIKTIDGGDNWLPQNSGIATNLIGVTAANSSIAWAVGLGGVILKTIDGGDNWLPQNSGVTSHLTDVISVTNNATTAWAVGLGGVILKTIDGGDNWLPQNSGIITGIIDVDAIDESTATAVGQDGVILRTTNGTDWTNVNNTNFNTSTYFNTVAMRGAENFWLGGTNGQIYKSGADTIIYNKSLSQYYNFKGVHQTENSLWAINQTSPLNCLILSEDQGLTWQLKLIPTGTIVDFSALDDLHIWVVDNGRNVYFTEDGGSTWAKKNIAGSFYPTSISAIDDSTAWVITNSKGIYKTTDTGDNWTLQTSDTPSAVAMNNIDAIDANTAWAAGAGGTIIKTTNGTDWIVQTSNTMSNLTKIAALPGANTAWAVGAGGTIIKTENGGANWSTQTSGTAADLLGLYATDQSNLFVSGNNGLILKTTNGGDIWRAQQSGSSTNLVSISANSPASAFAVGSAGTILRYSAPLNATATKLLIKLPGQSFDEENGITGTPDPLAVNQPFSATVYAVDDENKIDNGDHKYPIRFTTTDPDDIHPPEAIMNGESGSCDGTSDNPCGITTAQFNFHTPSLSADQNWVISASFPLGNISPATTEPIHVNRAPVSDYTLTSNNTSAGSVSSAGIATKDIFGSSTPVTLPTNFSITSSNSSLKLASSYNSGSWKDETDIAMKENTSFALFYYYGNEEGVYSVTISAQGLPTKTFDITIVAGSTVRDKSSFQCDNSSFDAGESISCTVRILDASDKPIPYAQVRMQSSRTNEAVTPAGLVLTDYSGNASFSITSTKAGIFTLTAYLSSYSHNFYLSQESIINVLPISAASLNLSSNKGEDQNSTINLTAGEGLELKAELYDKYGNLATSSSRILSLSSSDKKAQLNTSSHTLSSRDNGMFTFELSLRTAGEQKIKVTSSALSAEKTINVSPSIFSAITSSFTSSKKKLVLGKDKATITSRTLDQFGNALSNKRISLNLDSDIAEIMIPLGKTDNDGLAAFELTPKKEGKISLSAYNETDKAAIGEKIIIDILSDSIVNNIVSTVDTLQTALKNSEIAQTVAKVTEVIVATTATLGLIPIVANIIGGVPQAFHLATYVYSLGLEAIGIRRRKKSWGRVYDSTTGRGVGMALVRLFDQASMKLKGTVVTDPKGRFSFQPEPGNYVISVAKNSFVFPTTIFARYGISNISKAAARVNRHYVGQTINIDDKNNVINIEVPIDPVDRKATLWLKMKILLGDTVELVTHGLSYIFIPTLIIGILMSAFSAVMITNPRNIALLLAYIVITLVYAISKMIKSKHFGVVYDSETKKPLVGAVVSVFESQYHTLKETRITDRYGRFSFMAQKGIYNLEVEADNYKFPSKKIFKNAQKDHKYTDIYLGEKFQLKDTGFIHVSIPVDKKN